VSPASSAVICETHGAVALVRLSREHKGNAFDAETSRAFVTLLDRLDADEGVRAVVLTGSGRAFSAGADMAESLTAAEGSGADGMARATMRVMGFTKPIVAAVNGYAHGGGALLAITCDMRIASPGASFRFPGAAYGLIVGGSQLPRIIGPGYAKELLLTGRVADAAESERIGLVNRVVPEEELEREALAVASDIAANDPEAVRATKLVVDRASEVDDGLRVELEENRRLHRSPEHRRRFRQAAERVAGAGEGEESGGSGT
jgi:enoyl-CoA hydratase/carnithine racemase